jgi:hypothetical protein
MMSVLRYNIVSDKKPFKAREEYLKRFFANVKRGTQPVSSNSEESTIITDRATSSGADDRSARKRVKRNKIDKSDKSEKTVGKGKKEDKIDKHKFS